eukprot:GHVT01064938.1.p2 GENE.GHVT01064938.1~~GHVT01064938.1.p2  ORF type:complete len:107 (-),score=17.04 GHVT01064938.1:807-1127(-)
MKALLVGAQLFHEPKIGAHNWTLAEHVEECFMQVEVLLGQQVGHHYCGRPTDPSLAVYEHPIPLRNMFVDETSRLLEEEGNWLATYVLHIHAAILHPLQLVQYRAF